MGINLVGKEQASFSGDAVLTTGYDDDSIVRGLGFTFEKNFSILSGATLNILVDYSAWAPEEDEYGLIYILPPVFRTTAGPVIVNVYRGTDYTGGTEFDAINPNTTASKTTSGTTFTSGATGSTKGDIVLEYLVGGAGIGPANTAGSSTGLGFFIRTASDKTLVEVVNNSGNDITFNYSQLLFEI